MGGSPSDTSDSEDLRSTPKPQADAVTADTSDSGDLRSTPKPQADAVTADTSESEANDDGRILETYRRVMFQFSFIGIEFGVALLLGVLLGRWLDKKFGTAPWLMLACVLFSLMVASRDLYRLIRRAYREQSDKDRQS